MRVIFGLGNPGIQYRDTRHNLGFMVVDRLSELHKIELTTFSHHGWLGEGSLVRKKILLVKPLTFVNEAGKSVAEIRRAYGLSPQDILIINDDADLELGKLRISEKGGDGGHKGLRSIIQCLGTQEIPRLRVGIGRPQEDEDLTEFVLGEFTSQEKKIVKDAVERAAEAVEVLVKCGIEEAMSRYN